VKGRCPRPLDDGDLVSVDRNAVGDRESIGRLGGGRGLAPG
jgi:hypothetical protein